MSGWWRKLVPTHASVQQQQSVRFSDHRHLCLPMTRWLRPRLKPKTDQHAGREKHRQEHRYPYRHKDYVPRRKKNTGLRNRLCRGQRWRWVNPFDIESGFGMRSPGTRRRIGGRGQRHRSIGGCGHDFFLLDRDRPLALGVEQILKIIALKNQGTGLIG
jgi:hypothetical protein